MTVVYEDLGDEAEDAVPIRRIRFSINGKKMIAEVEPRLLLAHLIRRGLGLTGTHMGCDTTNCGACTGPCPATSAVAPATRTSSSRCSGPPPSSGPSPRADQADRHGRQQ